jgi:hypothetical protein
LLTTVLTPALRKKHKKWGIKDCSSLLHGLKVSLIPVGISSSLITERSSKVNKPGGTASLEFIGFVAFIVFAIQTQKSNTVNRTGDPGNRPIKIDDLSFISYLVNRASHGADFRALRDEEIGGIDKGSS